MNVQFWHEDKLLGDDMEIGLELNTDGFRCPYCRKKPRLILTAMSVEEYEGVWQDIKIGIGCEECVDAFEEGEDGYSDEFVERDFYDDPWYRARWKE